MRVIATRRGVKLNNGTVERFAKINIPGMYGDGYDFDLHVTWEREFVDFVQIHANTIYNVIKMLRKSRRGSRDITLLLRETRVDDESWLQDHKDNGTYVEGFIGNSPRI